jgi:hypothetical protein
MILEIFQLPQVRGGKNSKKSFDFYIWFFVCSQKHKKEMIKDNL